MTNFTRIQPVILCGGSGTRLWPLSRSGFPKQFLSLTGEESLFQLATKRLENLVSDNIHVAESLVVTGEEHRFLALEQIREARIKFNAILLEPIGRNTAPALTFAALAAIEKGEDPILAVTPADQIVADYTTFSIAMHAAISQAAKGNIVIFGITPDCPATGYDYIQTDVLRQPSNQALPVRRFVEKPDADTAQTYLGMKNFYWNSGIFVLKASIWLKALDAFRPDIAQATRLAWEKRTVDANPTTPFTRPGRTEFMVVPSESIDCAVIKHCPGSVFPIQMIPLNAGWNDLGAWNAIWQILPKDDNNNAHMGDVLIADSRNTLVHASSRLVSIVGVNNLIVIETSDAVLVVDKSRSQNVKDIVSELHANRREEHTLHRKVHRPWGWYDCIDQGSRFKVKRILVKPGASLSLQKHHYRAEHWIVVKGTAEITNGNSTVLLTENQSTYISLGEVHRLSNPSDMPLEIIEVQSGDYMGEDDIVRFDDHYGR